MHVQTIGLLKPKRLSTYLSLNALKILSTSSSRWRADASRVRSFSSSASVDSAGVDDPEPATVFDDDDGSEDMAINETSDRVQVEGFSVPVIFPPESLSTTYSIPVMLFLRSLSGIRLGSSQISVRTSSSLLSKI